jgi:hypothetical protein
MIVPLTHDNIFPGGVHHRLIVPNRVLEIRRDSIILEKEFEGSQEVFFFVSIFLCYGIGKIGKRVRAHDRNAFWQLVQASLRL